MTGVQNPVQQSLFSVKITTKMSGEIKSTKETRENKLRKCGLRTFVINLRFSMI